MNKHQLIIYAVIFSIFMSMHILYYLIQIADDIQYVKDQIIEMNNQEKFKKQKGKDE